MKPTAKPNLKLIRQRAELLRDLRNFFDSRDFLEVQPPCLSGDCVVDAYIDPIEVDPDQIRLGIELPDQFYLQTSPEAAMKRMLAAGAPSIYSLGPVFRAGERGLEHNVEFTMLEWYQVDADISDGIETLGSLASMVLQSDCYDVLEYREVFRQAIGIDPIDAAVESLRSLVADIDPALVRPDRDALLDTLLAHRIQANLGTERPLIVKNYPLSQAALARPSPDDSDCAARFELFAQGTELANGYDELRDADVLVERTAIHNETRIANGRQAIELDSSLVAAMRDGLPRCAGVALGVDRLLMIRTQSKSIDETLLFPIEIA